MDDKNRQSGHEPNGQGLRLVPKKWATFQHYKDRCPPWIKLHKNILDDRQYMCLPLASKALAPLLWLLASESKDGSFDADVQELSFRLRLPESDIVAGLNPLINKGFFLDASTMLAPRLHVAVPETEGEGEAKREAKKEMPAPVVAVPVSMESFERFWDVYDYRVGKQKATKAWKTINPDEELARKIIAAAELYSRANPTKTYYKHASTWLNGKHWEDDPAALVPKIARQAQQSRPASYSAGLAIFGNLEEQNESRRIIDITAKETPAGFLGG